MPEKGKSKKKKNKHHELSSSRRRSSSSQHAGESSQSQSHAVSAQSSAQSAAAQSFAAEHYNLRQLDDVRHQTGFQLAPQATQQQFNRCLQRREDDFYGRYEQYTAERGPQLALAQGPFAPGQVYEHIHRSRWEGPAENKAFDEVTYSGWWEQQEDEGDGHGEGEGEGEDEGVEEQGESKRHKHKEKHNRHGRR